MATRVWEPVQIYFCHHVGQKVALEAEVVYPAENLPDMQARVQAHRCSNYVECNLDGRPSCVWAGTNPTIDPFVAL